jgi:hypothetical protein
MKYILNCFGKSLKDIYNFCELTGCEYDCNNNQIVVLEVLEKEVEL